MSPPFLFIFWFWIRSLRSGGSIANLSTCLIHRRSVTMPLKTEILKHLDELTPATQATKACNTIVRVKREDGSYKLVGTNTDVLGKSRSNSLDGNIS